MLVAELDHVLIHASSHPLVHSMDTCSEWCTADTAGMTMPSRHTSSTMLQWTLVCKMPMVVLSMQSV